MPAPTVPNMEFSCQKQPASLTTALVNIRRPGRRGDVRVGDAVAVAAAEARVPGPAPEVVGVAALL